MRFRLSDRLISCSGKLTASFSKLLTIQALRGLAAVLIVIMHAFHEAGMGRPSYPFTVGVNIFFVISGFIMVYTSRNWFGVAGAWKKFMTRRLIRIVPVYWFYTFLLLAVAFVLPSALETVRFEPLHVVLSLLFIPHANPGGGLHPFLDLGWTLNYEMYFYTMFAALLFLPMNRMMLALSVFFVGSVAAGFFITPEYPALYFWTRPLVLEFLGGAWIGYLFLKDFRLPHLSVFLFPVLFGMLAFLPQEETLLRSVMWLGLPVLMTALAILPVGMDKAPVPRVFSEVGDASYTIYLSHPFVLAGLAIGLKMLSGWALLVLSVILAVFGGYILYLAVEKPLLSAAKRVFLRHEKAV